MNTDKLSYRLRNYNNTNHTNLPLIILIYIKYYNSLFRTLTMNNYCIVANHAYRKVITFCLDTKC